MPLLLTVQKKLTGSVVFQFSLRSCLQGPDKDSRLHAPPANNVNKDPQPHADVACSSTGGAAGSNGHIFPTWRPARRNPPRSLAVQRGLHSSRGKRHTSRSAQQLTDITKSACTYSGWKHVSHLDWCCVVLLQGCVCIFNTQMEGRMEREALMGITKVKKKGRQQGESRKLKSNTTTGDKL